LLDPQIHTMELPSTSAVAGEGESSWFAIQTRPRYEKKVVSELQEKDINVFLPLFSVTRRWSDRQRVVQPPLFPGYVFVRVAPTLNARVSILRTNGVTSFVGVRGVGTPIPDREIEALLTVIEQNVSFKPYPYLKIGERVCIRGGCLDGIEGMLTAINGDQSLVVSVEAIQRSIAIRITGFSVEPTVLVGRPSEHSLARARHHILGNTPI
jgi:transcription antitermination factor NusG